MMIIVVSVTMVIRLHSDVRFSNNNNNNNNNNKYIIYLFIVIIIIIRESDENPQKKAWKNDIYW